MAKNRFDIKTTTRSIRIALEYENNYPPFPPFFSSLILFPFDRAKSAGGWGGHVNDFTCNFHRLVTFHCSQKDSSINSSGMDNLYLNHTWVFLCRYLFDREVPFHTPNNGLPYILVYKTTSVIVRPAEF